MWSTSGSCTVAQDRLLLVDNKDVVDIGVIIAQLRGTLGMKNLASLTEAIILHSQVLLAAIHPRGRL